MGRERYSEKRQLIHFVAILVCFVQTIDLGIFIPHAAIHTTARCASRAQAPQNALN